MKCFVLFLLIASFASENLRANGKPQDVQFLHQAHEALTNVIIHDIFSPPVSSRIYLYAHISAYEVLVKSSNHYVSLQGQIKDFPTIPEPEQPIAPGLAAVHAFLLTGKKLVFSEAMIQDSIQLILEGYKKTIATAEWQPSLEYGEQISDIIVAWANADQYGPTRKLRRYNFRKEEGNWKPTPPVYMAAIEPHWVR